MANEFSSNSGRAYSGRGGKFGSDFFYVVSDYLNYLTDSEMAKLSSLKQKYLDSLEISRNNIKDLDYAGWKDDVSTKLSTFTKTLNDTLLGEIESDIDSGNFLNLVNALIDLKFECEKYKDEENRTISLHFRNEDDSKLYYEKYNVSLLSSDGQRDYQNYKNALDERTRNLTTIEENVKSILASIKSISFGGQFVESESVQTEIIQKETNLPTGVKLAGQDYYLVDGIVYKNIAGIEVSGQILLNRETGDGIMYTEDGLILFRSFGNEYVRDTYLVQINSYVDLVDDSGNPTAEAMALITGNIDRLTYIDPKLQGYENIELMNSGMNQTQTITALIDGKETKIPNLEWFQNRAFPLDTFTQSLNEEGFISDS